MVTQTAKCSARNPATCRNHGIVSKYPGPNLSTNDFINLSTDIIRETKNKLKLKETTNIKLPVTEAYQEAVNTNPENPATVLIPALEKEIENQLIKEYENKHVSVKKSPVKDNWCELKFGEYTIKAKVFEENSHYGVEHNSGSDGRVSKISIYNDVIRHEKMDFFAATICNYDRGWDKKPASRFEKYVYRRVMKKLGTYLDTLKW